MIKQGDISPYQGTVTKKLEFAGVGLHSGKLIELEIHPAPVGHGIQFLRTDQSTARPVAAIPGSVSCAKLCTTIGHGSSRVSTIEHLMAAFSGLGIDNALVRVNAPELPILDGSSAPYVDKLVETGMQVQGIKRRVLVPLAPVGIRHGDQFIRLEPIPGMSAEECALSPLLDMICSIDFADNQLIGFQKTSIRFSAKSFMELCEARTFCLESDIRKMWDQGLALGGSLDNAVVVGSDRIMNNDGLRFSDEFVRHKLLDCIGDLALLGARLCGTLTMHKAGHALHTEFAAKILSSPMVASFPEQSAPGPGALEGLGLAAMARTN